jgi:hypothetical protein
MLLQYVKALLVYSRNIRRDTEDLYLGTCIDPLGGFPHEPKVFILVQRATCVAMADIVDESTQTNVVGG